MSSVREVVTRLEHEVGLEEFEQRQKKNITIRLTAWNVQRLMNIANHLKMNKTQCAQQLLEAAIDDAVSALHLPELDSSEQGLVFNMENQPGISEE